MAPFEQRYDTILEIQLHRQSSFDTSGPRGNFREHIISAASNTEKRLLIRLSRTDAWMQLYAQSSRSFDVVQTLLSEIYVLAQSKLGEDAGVDVVIDVLRGETGGFASATARKVIYSDEEEAELSQAPGASSQAGASASSLEQDGRDAGKSPAYLGTVALGGTFDHLHPGHQILLTMACWLAKRRTIVGITDDVLLKNKSDRDLLESLSTRTANVRAFLNLTCPTLQHDTPPLQDVYGPTATDPDVQAVLVSEETRGGAASIAKKRKEDGLCSLELFVIKVISPESILDPASVSKEDLAKSKIGSTQIRRRLRQRLEEQKKAGWTA